MDTDTSSSCILRISFGTIEDIPESARKVVPTPTDPFLLPLKVKLNEVYAIGYCATPLRVIKVFSFFFFISNWWILPDPVEVNVNPIPDNPETPVILNLSLSIFKAYTLDGHIFVEIPVEKTDLKVVPVETFDICNDGFKLLE